MRLIGYINQQVLKLLLLVTSFSLSLYIIAKASSRVPSKPVRKVQPITPEILGLIFKQYSDSIDLLDIRFVCTCLLAYADFSAFLNFYALGDPIL